MRLDLLLSLSLSALMSFACDGSAAISEDAGAVAPLDAARALDTSVSDAGSRDGPVVRPDGAPPPADASDGSSIAADGAADGLADGSPPPDAAIERVWRMEPVLGADDGLLVPDGLFPLGGSEVLIANEGTREVLIADVDRRQVQVRVPAGTGLVAPEEVALGADGTLYVSDDSARTVFRVGPDGALETVIGRSDGLESPEGIAVAADGTLFVGDERASFLARKRPGQPLEILADEADGVFAPEGLALGPDGTLYATDDRRGGVMAIDPDGTPRIFLDRDALGLPEAVALAPDGNLWFTDNGGAATLQRFSPAGEHLETLPTPLERGALAGIAALADGRLVFSVYQRDPPVHQLWLVWQEPAP